MYRLWVIVALCKLFHMVLRSGLTSVLCLIGSLDEFSPFWLALHHPSYTLHSLAASFPSSHLTLTQDCQHADCSPHNLCSWPLSHPPLLSANVEYISDTRKEPPWKCEYLTVFSLKMQTHWLLIDRDVEALPEAELWNQVVVMTLKQNHLAGRTNCLSTVSALYLSMHDKMI